MDHLCRENGASIGLIRNLCFWGQILLKNATKKGNILTSRHFIFLLKFDLVNQTRQISKAATDQIGKNTQFSGFSVCTLDSQVLMWFEQDLMSLGFHLTSKLCYFLVLFKNYSKKGHEMERPSGFQCYQLYSSFKSV